jgi:hypothetical protein
MKCNVFLRFIENRYTRKLMNTERIDATFKPPNQRQIDGRYDISKGVRTSSNKAVEPFLTLTPF